MQFSYVELDDRLDALRAAEDAAPASVRRDFERRLMLSWLYHDLHLEGVIVTQGDLERALAGLSGRDYCDDVLLDRIRGFYRALQRMRDNAERKERLSLNTVMEYHAVLSGGDVRDALRTDDGATGAYKHDVADPSEVEQGLQDIIAQFNTGLFFQHPIKLALTYNFRFAKLWPFNDHSATIARLLSNQALLANGYPPIIVHANDRQAYYHSLHYDITRLRDFLATAYIEQIELRERVFQHRREPLGAARASV